MTSFIKNPVLPAAAGILFAALLAVAGCGAGHTTAGTEAESAAETAAADRDDVSGTGSAVVNGRDVIRCGGRLYFRYDNVFYELDPSDDTMRTLMSLEGGESSQAFWIYNGGLYFDMEFSDEKSDGLTGLYRFDLDDGTSVHMADVDFVPTEIYASNGLLYVRDADENAVYGLNADGVTAEPADVKSTALGKIPSGCLALPVGVTAYAAEHFNYMPLVDGNSLTLVLCDADGKNLRSVPDVMDTTSALFCRDSFYTVSADAEGNWTFYRYDAADPVPCAIAGLNQKPELIQEDSGYLYYLVRDDVADRMSAFEYYRIPVGGGDAEEIDRIEPQVSMGQCQEEMDLFFADGNHCWYPVYSGQSVLMTDRVPGGDSTNFDSAMEESAVNRLGEAVADSGQTGTGGGPGIRWYSETIQFSDDGTEAPGKMTAAMEEGEKTLTDTAEMLSSAKTSGTGSAVNLDYAGVTALERRVEGEKGITFYRNRYVCIETDFRRKTGGVWKTYTKEYYVFDRTTGDRLSLADLVNNSEEELGEMVGEAFARLEERTNFSFESPDSLKNTVAGRISYNSPFYITSEGIVFYFDPGDISPEVEGFPEVLISYRDLDLKILR